MAMLRCERTGIVLRKSGSGDPQRAPEIEPLSKVQFLGALLPTSGISRVICSLDMSQE
jgi:hypothetical protein